MITKANFDSAPFVMTLVSHVCVARESRGCLVKIVSFSLGSGTRTLDAIALPPSDYSVKADTAIDCCGQQFPKWNESLSKKWSLFAPLLLSHSLLPLQTFSRCLPFVLIVITPSATAANRCSGALGTLSRLLWSWNSTFKAYNVNFFKLTHNQNITMQLPQHQVFFTHLT